jgi:RecB family exonuclease
MDAEGNPLILSLFLEEAERAGLLARAPAQDGGTPPARQIQLGIGAALLEGGEEAVGNALDRLRAAQLTGNSQWGWGLARGALLMAERDGRAAPGRFSGMVDAPDLKTLLGQKYGPGRPISVTRLEAYGKCPFRFFAEEILGLVKVDVEDLEEDRRGRGRAVHRILERFYKEKTTPGFAGAATFLSEKARLAAIAAEEMAIAAPPDPVREWDRDNWLTGGGGALGNFLARETEIAKNQKEDGRPILMEWRFDDLGLEDEQGNRLILKGKVDRVDLINRRYLCVLDYKSGWWKGNLQDMVKEGAHLQIPLYIEAARQRLNQGIVQGGGIYSLAPSPAEIPSGGHLALPEVGRAYGKRSKLTPENFETSIKTAKQRALEHLGSITAGRFQCSRHDEEVSGCEYCVFRWGCGRRTGGAGEVM